MTKYFSDFFSSFLQGVEACTRLILYWRQGQEPIFYHKGQTLNTSFLGTGDASMIFLAYFFAVYLFEFQRVWFDDYNC